MAKAMEYGHKIWYVECKKFAEARFANNNFEITIKIQVTFTESSGGQTGQVDG
jgi:hypothetical protein